MQQRKKPQEQKGSPAKTLTRAQQEQCGILRKNP